MDNQIVAIEISAKAIKLLIGFEESGKPIVQYRREIPLERAIAEGQIVDEKAIVDALSSLREISDPAAQLHCRVNNVCLLLPNDGFSVYVTKKATNTVSPDSRIGRTDIANAVSLAQKEQISQGSEIIDIIPISFKIDGDRQFMNPPLGEQSRFIEMNAMIHALPTTVKGRYMAMAQKAGFRVMRSAIQGYASALEIRSENRFPDSYILMDIGSDSTSLTLIGRHLPYGAVTFYNGGDSLTENLADAFSLTMGEAERVKCEYGFCPRARKYQRPIFQSSVTGHSFTQKELNEVILRLHAQYEKLLKNAFTILEKRGEGIARLPILVCGGASRMKGHEELLRHAFPGRELRFVVPTAIGARDPGEVALLGLILASSRYIGSLEENRVYEGQPLGEGKKAKKAAKRSASVEKDAL